MNASDDEANVEDYERQMHKEHYKRYEDYHESRSAIRNIPKQRTKKVDKEHAWNRKNFSDDD